MTTDERKIVFDVRFLLDASRKLHGYFLYRWFARYLSVIVENAQRLMDHGMIGPGAQPSEETDYALLFDIDALDLEAISYLIGVYFYILSCHKKTNYYLMQQSEAKRVLYLRGFDYEAVVASDGVAAEFSSMDTMQFSFKLGEELANELQLFMAMSSKDLYWETIDAQEYFYGDFENILDLASEPIRSFYLNANYWQEDIARLFDRMDYFIVYVSSITESVLWEINQLEHKGRAQHATLVYDEEAIANKELQSNLQTSMTEEYPDGMRWTKSKSGAPGLSAKELREELAAIFLVVTPDEFFADLEALKNRIAAASAPLSSTSCKDPMDFRFYPALDADKLKEIQDFDKALGGEIHQQVSSRTITNLPWFMNQVQLKIVTTLMLGNHAETGLMLAVYAAVTDVVRDQLLSSTGRGADLTKRQRTQISKKLKEHFEMAEYVSHMLLSYGQSHEFGDYTALADEGYKETFAAASAAVADFFEKARQRWGD